MWKRRAYCIKISTKLNGEQTTHPSSMETAQSYAITDGMIDNWDGQVDEEGYGCPFIQHQQKLPSIVNKPRPKTKEKKGSTVHKLTKDTIIKDFPKDQPSMIFNKVKGRLNPLWILLDNQLTVHVFCNDISLHNIRTVEK